LDQLVQVATAIFYNKDLEKERRKEKHQVTLILFCRPLLHKQP
jgi:hypothetical protein